jgi:hypothetical protein
MIHTSIKYRNRVSELSGMSRRIGKVIKIMENLLIRRKLVVAGLRLTAIGFNLRRVPKVTAYTFIPWGLDCLLGDRTPFQYSGFSQCPILIEIMDA